MFVSREYVNSTLQDASNKEVAGIAIVVLVLVVSPIIIILMRNAVATIQVCDSSCRYDFLSCSILAFITLTVICWMLL